MNEQQPLPVELGCGAVVADLLLQVSEGHASDLTPHQVGCPYCKLTLSRLADSWRIIEHMRAERLQPSPQLLARVMGRIQAGLDHWQVEIGSGQGVTRVSSTVLASLAFWAATAAPGVRQVFRAEPSDSGVLSPGRSKNRRGRLVSPANLRIELELGVQYGVNALDVAEEVRRAVMAQVWEMTGLELARVDLTIADVG
jgi:uncharacterized alkaline shock family protein YloU